MFEGAAPLVFILFWLVIVWVLYMVIKAAVRNGILEAEARRVRIHEREARAAQIIAERRASESDARDGHVDREA